VNPRKGTFLFGARAHSSNARLPLRIALVQGALRGGISSPSLDQKMLLCVAGMVAAAALYNWPRYGWKAPPTARDPEPGGLSVRVPAEQLAE